MGIVIAAIVVVAASVGAGMKEGVFKKGYDTTRRDTIAFEKQALEQRLAKEQSKQRQVVELTPGTTEEKLAKTTARQEKLEAKIAKLEGIEKEMGWDQ